MNAAISDDDAKTGGEAVGGEMREFLDLAERIAMPLSERLEVLAVDGGTMASLAAEPLEASHRLDAASRRRLAYILPLMRRSLANLQCPC